jgi:iron complex outermembrane receptor protein
MANVANTLGSSNQGFTETHRGFPLRLRYEKTLNDGSSLQIQSAYAHANMRIPYLINDRRDTFDLDMHHQIRLGESHEVVWGGGYRYSMDTMSSTPSMHMNMLSRQLGYYGLFGQDEITLLDSLRLVLGLRLDHNDMSGWEIQPNARLSWNLASTQTLWGSLSRVSRAPSRGEQGFSFNRGYVAGAPANTLVVVQGDPDFGPEQLVASEIGLRSKWAPSFSTDAVVFRHDYTDLRTVGPPTSDASGFPLVVSRVPITNGGRMTLVGAELSADWRLAPSWHLQAALTRNDVMNSGNPSVDAAGQVPKFISSLRVSWTPAAGFNVDAWLRHTGDRQAPNNALLRRDGFNSFDLRLAWRPADSIELSLTGKNLTESECNAFSKVGAVRENQNIIPTCQPRSLIGQARLDF